MGGLRQIVAVAAAGAAVSAGTAAAATSVSYSGEHGQAVYSSFVVKGGKVTGLYVGGVCLPNVTVVEPGTNSPLSIRRGVFAVTRANGTYKVSVTGTAIANGRYRVQFTLRNKRAKSLCSYKVVAKPMGSVAGRG